MGDISVGEATSFPSALDTNDNPEDGTGDTTHLPGLGALSAIMAVEAELGTDPAGTKQDVKTFNQIEHNTNGTHKFIKGSVAWDPGSIADGGEEPKDVTVTGAALGDFAIGSFSLDVLDLVINAAVTAPNTVTVVLANNTGGAVDLGSGTVYAIVIKAY